MNEPIAISIDLLPNELLQLIFETLFNDSNISFVDDDEDDGDDFGEDDFGPPVSHTLSHVCSRWRELALCTPCLWTDIRIFHFRHIQVEMVKRSLAQSRDLPLSIRLQNDSKWTTMLDYTPRETVEALMSCISRWESVRIIMREVLMSGWFCLFQLARTDAPLLKRLMLGMSDVEDYETRRIRYRDCQSVPCTVFGNMPCLRVLRLYGISMDMPTDSPCLSKLENLRLSHSSVNMLNGKSADNIDFTSPPLVRTPHLHTLWLDSTLPPIDIPISGPSLLFENTSRLTSLTLSNMRGFPMNKVTALFSHLSTPLLQELSLINVDSEFWLGLMYSSRCVDTGYPNVRRLTLCGLQSFDSFPAYRFMSSFPALEEISLDEISPGVDLFLTDLSSCFLLPLPLHTLNLFNVRFSWETLCELVERRLSYDNPIVHLFIKSRSDDIHRDGYLSWLGEIYEDRE